MSTSKIVNIRKIAKRDRYDLTVNTTHNFFADGVLIHNTSGRTGYVKWTQKNLFQKVLSKFGLYHDKYRYVTGTRKVVFHPDDVNDKGFYAGTNFRKEIHEYIVKKGLKKGEIVYYEIVGYTSGESLIMPSHEINKDEMKEAGIPSKEYKRYGDAMTYLYGCEPDQYKVFVYRIVQDGKDLSYFNMINRCYELGLNEVPLLGHILISETDTAEDIMNKAETFTRGESVLDNRHIREGICLRKDKEDGTIRVLKYKGFLFCMFEGIRKNSDDYLDMEEIS